MLVYIQLNAASSAFFALSRVSARDREYVPGGRAQQALSHDSACFLLGDVASAAMRLAVAALISQKVMKKSIYIVFGF
ncbi:hypothetical protein [Vogesella alkaliphila]|uniref:hypothetical protein n=1 Tax=Vogesella alkaliphila TaxID=1193621 RepID=UPI00167A1DF9|nr:hypothetical protein [Vogesella alkaliphila]